MIALDEATGYEKVRVFAVKCVEVLRLVRRLELGDSLDIEVDADVRVEVWSEF